MRTLSRKSRPESGTALLLYPAGVLVLLLFGAMAIDLAAIRDQRTELSNLARTAADDAAAAVDIQRLRQGDPLVIDLDVARQFVAIDLENQRMGGAQIRVDSIHAGADPGTVVVELSATVPHIIATWMGDQPLHVRATGRRTIT